MCDCNNLFLNDIPNQERVSHILKYDSNGDCEYLQTSSHSKGAVSDDEIIARAVIFPHMFSNQPISLNETIFTDAFDKGGSSQRLNPNIDDEIKQVKIIHDKNENAADMKRCDPIKPQKDRVYIGILRMLVSEVRMTRLDHEEKRRVRVYDSAELEDPEHADIIVDSRGIDSSSKQDKLNRKIMRQKLLKIAEKRGLEISPYLPADFPSIFGVKIFCRDNLNNYALLSDPLTNTHIFLA